MSAEAPLWEIPLQRENVKMEPTGRSEAEWECKDGPAEEKIKRKNKKNKRKRKKIRKLKDGFLKF